MLAKIQTGVTERDIQNYAKILLKDFNERNIKLFDRPGLPAAFSKFLEKRLMLIN